MVIVKQNGEELNLDYSETISNMKMGDYFIFRFPENYFAVFQVVDFLLAPSGKYHWIQSLCIGGNKNHITGKLYKLSIKDARLSDYSKKYENPKALIVAIFTPYKKRY